MHLPLLALYCAEITWAVPAVTTNLGVPVVETVISMVTIPGSIVIAVEGKPRHLRQGLGLPSCLTLTHLRQ